MILVSKRQAAGKSGTVMVAVIWVIAIITVATVAAVRVLKFDVDVAAAKIHGTSAQLYAEMGIAVAANSAVKRGDPLLTRMDEKTGEGYEARIRSEGGRFNINSILMQGDRDLLGEIFNGWGVDQKEVQAVVDALVDWMDPDNNVSLTGAEEEEYLKMGRTNQPFNRPFFNLEEMRLVKGMELVEAVKPDWREWFTVYSNGPLDLNEAEPELIAMAADCPIERAVQLREMVCGPDGIRDTQDDVPFQNVTAALDLLGISANDRPDLARRFSVNDATSRIESIGYAAGAKRKITIVLRNRSGKPGVIERQEEIIP